MFPLALFFTLVCATQAQGSNLLVKGSCRANCTFTTDGQLTCQRLLGVGLLKVQCCLDAFGHYFLSRDGIEQCEKCEACENQAFNPVCASNGVTYGSPCALRSAMCRMPHLFIQKSYDGVCQQTCDKVRCDQDSSCTYDERNRPVCVQLQTCQESPDSTPVCGIDGTTYASECALQNAWANSQNYLAVAYQGECNKNVTCKSLRCSRHKYLVKLTRSAWMTPHMECIEHRLSKTPRCMPTMVSNCERTRRLCGSDGYVYDNYCNLLQQVEYTKTSIDVLPMSMCNIQN